MKIYDRLYGEMKFPTIIQELLDCPSLLRLRDVRMANNQFVTFPAFANSSRYEHSLGVCYLAGICAQSLRLSEKDSIELMMACLYHDVSTPPFAHAMEEVLQAEFGFDHEENLRKMIEGRNDSYAGNLEQVYLGESSKLRSVCQSKQGRALKVDIYRIAKIVVGDKSDPLSALLNGNGMDLDNIDNVVRASSAMGLLNPKEYSLAIRLANSFVFDVKGNICFQSCHLDDIRRWQQIRDEQYTAIFSSIDDFAYQTMIKKALSLLLKDKTTEYKLHSDSWKLTDSSIVYEYLLKSPQSEPIMRRVLLCKPFYCLGILYVQGNNVNSYINTHLSDIEEVVSKCYQDIVGMDGKVENKRFSELNTNSVVANYYPDKRKRHICNDALFMGETNPIDSPNNNESGALLGLFSPLYNSNYTTVNLDGENRDRKQLSFKNSDLDIVAERLRHQVLQNYEVSIYERKAHKRNNYETTGDQLELF